MKKIKLIYTGGTICTTLNGQIKSVNKDTARALPTYFKQSDSSYVNQVEFEDGEYFGILSENMTVDKWNTLIEYFLNDVLPKVDEYSGIIVAHGTDTLAFSASLFSVLLKGITIPVFFVSSNEQILDENKNINANANGNENFKTAVECICKGLSAGVYVPYRNIKRKTALDQNVWEEKVFVHAGQRLEQCKVYSENFYSFNPIKYSVDKIFAKKKVQHQKKSLLIERFKDCKLKDCVLKIQPYVGLNYSRFNLDGIKAVLHGVYHSGTACVVKTEECSFYDHASILSLIDKCKENGIDFYYSPSKVGENDKTYDSVPIIKNHQDGTANFFYGITEELLYAKLLIAYSLNLSKPEIRKLLTVSKQEKVVK